MSFERVKAFMETHPTAALAAKPLKRDAEVRIFLSDLPGREFRFSMDDGRPRLEEAPAKDPDFTAELPPGAVDEMLRVEGDAGDFGICFFSLMLAREPERHVRVKLHSGLLKLMKRGYLGVLATGGPKVAAWMARKGLHGPGAVADAIKRLRSSS